MTSIASAAPTNSNLQEESAAPTFISSRRKNSKMKVTLMISVCTLLVLLQTTMAQFNNMRDPSFVSLCKYNNYACIHMKFISIQICSWPKCRPGTYFDKQECKCNGVTESTCAAGFTAVKSPHGLCSCQKKTRPHCPAGLPVLGNDCICTGTPTCPYGSILRPSTATCTAEPYCPYGADLFECKCVKEYVRQCPWGTLSWDGCECNTSYIPKCSDGCYLDYYGGCKCNNHYDHDHSMQLS